MEYYGKTDVGRQRSVNQDTFGAKLLAEDVLAAVVCDGMGGASGGGIASSIALDIYLTELSKNMAKYLLAKNKAEPSVELPRLICRSVNTANGFLNAISKRDSSLNGMGTTLVSALIFGGVLYACNIGDSRLYHIWDGGIEQITKDHSYVQYLIDSGKLSPADAKKSSKKNIITRAVGIDPQVEADVFRVEFGRKRKKGKAVQPAVEEAVGDPPGEYFLLCSDGLSNLLEDSEILSILRSKIYMYDELVVKVNMLIEAANSRGGNDNITALLIRV